MCLPNRGWGAAAVFPAEATREQQRLCLQPPPLSPASRGAALRCRLTSSCRGLSYFETHFPPVLSLTARLYLPPGFSGSVFSPNVRTTCVQSGGKLGFVLPRLGFNSEQHVREGVRNLHTLWGHPWCRTQTEFLKFVSFLECFVWWLVPSCSEPIWGFMPSLGYIPH